MLSVACRVGEDETVSLQVSPDTLTFPEDAVGVARRFALFPAVSYDFAVAFA